MEIRSKSIYLCHSEVGCNSCEINAIGCTDWFVERAENVVYDKITAVATNIFQNSSTRSLDRILSTGRLDVEFVNFFARRTWTLLCNMTVARFVS